MFRVVSFIAALAGITITSSACLSQDAMSWPEDDFPECRILGYRLADMVQKVRAEDLSGLSLRAEDRELVANALDGKVNRDLIAWKVKVSCELKFDPVDIVCMQKAKTLGDATKCNNFQLEPPPNRDIAPIRKYRRPLGVADRGWSGEDPSASEDMIAFLWSGWKDGSDDWPTW